MKKFDYRFVEKNFVAAALPAAALWRRGWPLPNLRLTSAVSASHRNCALVYWRRLAHRTVGVTVPNSRHQKSLGTGRTRGVVFRQKNLFWRYTTPPRRTHGGRRASPAPRFVVSSVDVKEPTHPSSGTIETKDGSDILTWVLHHRDVEDKSEESRREDFKTSSPATGEFESDTILIKA